MDFSALFKGIAVSPELALTAFVIGAAIIGIQRLFKTLFKFLNTHLTNIDGHFKSVASDLNGLKVEIVKIGEKLEAQGELIDNKIDNLDRRVSRLEDRKED